jgi:hypothetical protein
MKNAHHCCRCGKKAPANLFGKGWAAPPNGGFMCPPCYAGRQEVIRKCQRQYYSAKYHRAMDKYMRGGKP